MPCKYDLGISPDDAGDEQNGRRSRLRVKAPPEYDRLVSVYDLWSAADPASGSTLEFYAAESVATAGAVVELGVGNGRIALEVARRGKAITGVDISGAMLGSLREKAEACGVADRVRLIQADAREFSLHEPAALITFPFRSIGHLISDEDKLGALANILLNLQPGGRLLFDHYILSKAWAEAHKGLPHLMCTIGSGANGYTLVWDVYQFDFQTQTMTCYVIEEVINPLGEVLRKTYHPLSFSWIEPQQMEGLLRTAGFEVEAVYGDFDRGPLTDDSRQQIWSARRPERLAMPK